MQHDTIQFADGITKLVQLAEVQHSNPWKRALRSWCKDHRYYEIVEKTLQCGFEHHYLLIQDHAGEVRGIQPLFVVRQNLVEGLRGTVRSIVDTIRKIFPRFLTMRVL